MKAAARPASCLCPPCPPLDVFGVLLRGPVLVRARLRRGGFFSGGGAMGVRGLRALFILVVAGVKDQERRQGRLAVCDRLARRWMSLVCFCAALFWCGLGLGGVVFLAAAVLWVLEGCGGSLNALLEQQQMYGERSMATSS